MLSVMKLRLLGLRNEYLVFIIMTVMALGLTSVFGASMDGYKPTVLIINEDSSEYSQMLIEELHSHSKYNYVLVDYEESVSLVEEGNALLGIRIGNGFGRDINQGNTPSIDILKTKDDTDIMVLENIIGETIRKMLGNINMANITAKYIMEESLITDRDKLIKNIYDKAVENWRYRRPIKVTKEVLDSSINEYDSQKHSLIGFSIFFSMYTMVFGIGTILNDRQYNTWQRMIVSPLSKASILGGSLIVTFIIGGLQLGILIMAGKYLFNIDWGNSLPGILIIAGTFVFTVTCLGLFLSGMVKTHSQLGAVTPIVLTSTAMLGGCMWPLEIVNSKILLFLANLTPQKWAVEGMEKIAAYGYGIEAAIKPSLILLFMGLIFFGLGVRLVKFE